MPVSYGLAESDILDLLAEIMFDYHRPLHDAGVRVGVILAKADDRVVDAIVRKKHPLYAEIKVVPLIDRLTKGFDAQLLIDRRKYYDLRLESQKALIDHELSHIELAAYAYHLQEDKYGKATGEREISCERDDLDRPKLKSVPGDADAGDYFARVVRTWGVHAVELKNIRAAHAAIEKEYEESMQIRGKELLDKFANESTLFGKEDVK